MCPEKGEKFQEIICLINVTSNLNVESNFTMIIDFGDSETRFISFNLNSTLQFKKTFHKTGKFRIFSSFIQVAFNCTSFIESNFINN